MSRLVHFRVPDEFIGEIPDSPRGALSVFLRQAIKLWIATEGGRIHREAPQEQVLAELNGFAFELSRIGVNLNQLVKDWHAREQGRNRDVSEADWRQARDNVAQAIKELRRIIAYWRPD